MDLFVGRQVFRPPERHWSICANSECLDQPRSDLNKILKHGPLALESRLTPDRRYDCSVLLEFVVSQSWESYNFVRSIFYFVEVRPLHFLQQAFISIYNICICDLDRISGTSSFILEFLLRAILKSQTFNNHQQTTHEVAKKPDYSFKLLSFIEDGWGI